MMNTIEIRIRGTVQGVGFRPFVYRLARDCSIKGWVQNTPEGVVIEAEAPGDHLEVFMRRFQEDLPPHCIIETLAKKEIPPRGFKSFEILPSDTKGEQTTLVLPDMATCQECLREIFDIQDRRYLYPFTNCTHCGPRYSIIESLPYDRANTSMKHFQMCPLCQKEYEDPLDRRFHAQPNACPVCGPWLQLWDAQGRVLAVHGQAMEKTAKFLKQGAIVAVKGLGGFHLMADATDENTLQLLRRRKNRPHKPLAVMFPSLAAIENVCKVSGFEKRLLVSAQAPIVLVRKKEDSPSIAPSVAPDNPYVGAMLACMPLQHILLYLCQSAVVATSGNISDEPICIDNQEVLTRLDGIADYFLVHNRPIVRQVDDSLLQEVQQGPYFLRRSRGFAPLPVKMPLRSKGILAVGAHQKNTVALSLERSAIISQHIGDLDTKESIDVFERTVESLRQIYSSPLREVICDMHPDYTSSRYAKDLQVPVVTVQHHQAHVASCLAEHGIEDSVLGVCFDGTGYGEDGTIWGGEFFKNEGNEFKRVAHFRLFPLPGGEIAISQPRRCALGLLYVLGHGNLEPFTDLACMKSFSLQEVGIIKKMLSRNINTPMTSSMGRLFDAISSLVGLCHKTTFEGQAAMALEFQAEGNHVAQGYPYAVMSDTVHKDCLVIDWADMVSGVVDDVRRGVTLGQIAAKFHYTLIEIIVDVASRVGENKVVLTGGCFQNKILTEGTIGRLKQKGFVPFWHSQIPPNDGGIALGQIWLSARRKAPCV